MCVCQFVVFLPPHASRPRRTCSPLHGKLFYNKIIIIIIVIFAENAIYGRPLLASNAANYSGATKYGYQRNPRNASMTLRILFAVLTENDSFRSCIQHNRLPPPCAYPQYKIFIIKKYVYIHN